VDEVVTIDVHSERDKQLFPVPLMSTFPAEIFANAIRKHQLTDATIVAPDNGAIPRCQAVNIVFLGSLIAYLVKKGRRSW
jgi:ribose-phosphate pyrophosphokinase